MSLDDAKPVSLELRCTALLSSVPVLNELLEVAMKALQVEASVRHDVTLAIAELVTNLYRHEYGGREGEVGIGLQAEDRILQITVESTGAPFDLAAALKKAEERDPLEELTTGGMGLQLIDTLFDNFESTHEEGVGNRIVLQRRLG